MMLLMCTKEINFSKRCYLMWKENPDKAGTSENGWKIFHMHP